MVPVPAIDDVGMREGFVDVGLETVDGVLGRGIDDERRELEQRDELLVEADEELEAGGAEAGDV